MIVSIVLFASIVLALYFLNNIKRNKNKHKDNGSKHKFPGVLSLLKSIYQMIFTVKNDGNLINFSSVHLKLNKCFFFLRSTSNVQNNS